MPRGLAAAETPTTLFGEALKSQVEERLEFFETGAPPKKNLDTMRSVLAKLDQDGDAMEEDASEDESDDE